MQEPHVHLQVCQEPVLSLCERPHEEPVRKHRLSVLERELLDMGKARPSQAHNLYDLAVSSSVYFFVGIRGWTLQESEILLEEQRYGY